MGTMCSAIENIGDAPVGTLPYYPVSNRDDVTKLAGCFGLTTDIESVEKRYVSEHVRIAKACIVYKYYESCVFKQSGLQTISVAKRSLSLMQEQTSRLFFLHPDQTSSKHSHDVPSPQQEAQDNVLAGRSSFVEEANTGLKARSLRPIIVPSALPALDFAVIEQITWHLSSMFPRPLPWAITWPLD
jgi:hypothetical protein